MRIIKKAEYLIDLNKPVEILKLIDKDIEIFEKDHKFSTCILKNTHGGKCEYFFLNKPAGSE